MDKIDLENTETAGGVDENPLYALQNTLAHSFDINLAIYSILSHGQPDGFNSDLLNDADYELIENLLLEKFEGKISNDQIQRQFDMFENVKLYYNQTMTPFPHKHLDVRSVPQKLQIYIAILLAFPQPGGIVTA